MESSPACITTSRPPATWQGSAKISASDVFLFLACDQREELSDLRDNVGPWQTKSTTRNILAGCLPRRWQILSASPACYATYRFPGPGVARSYQPQAQAARHRLAGQQEGEPSLSLPELSLADSDLRW